MRVDVDLNVFKALTLLLRDESDNYNEVINRLLPKADAALTLAEVSAPVGHTGDGLMQPNGHFNAAKGKPDASAGAWIGNVFFPDGTQFRASYKGRTYLASIIKGRWIDEYGTERQSPSEAASAISRTNVNGWRFWYGQRPDDSDWRRLDEFRE